MVEDYNGDNMLDLAGIEAPTPSRPRPMSAPTLQTVLDTQPPPSSTQTRYGENMRTLHNLLVVFLIVVSLSVVYYQIFGSAAALPSKCAFDPQDNTIGRVPARTFAPPRTAGIIKRYIAQLEGIDYSQFEAIYPSESDVPIPDDTRIAILGDGGPGTSKESPLAISLRDADTPNSGPSLATPLTWSPVLLPAPLLPSITPPSPAISLPAPNAQLNTHQRSMSVSSQYSYDSTTPSLVGAAQPLKPKWTIGENGFAEPIESLTEAGKVVSRHQPPGWLSGQLQAVGHGTCCVW